MNIWSIISWSLHSLNLKNIMKFDVESSFLIRYQQFPNWIKLWLKKADLVPQNWFVNVIELRNVSPLRPLDQSMGFFWGASKFKSWTECISFLFHFGVKGEGFGIVEWVVCQECTDVEVLKFPVDSEKDPAAVMTEMRKQEHTIVENS